MHEWLSNTTDEYNIYRPKPPIIPIDVDYIGSPITLENDPHIKNNAAYKKSLKRNVSKYIGSVVDGDRLKLTYYYDELTKTFTYVEK